MPLIKIKSKKKLYTLISNARIVFAESTNMGGLNAIVSLDLEDFLNGGDAEQICASLSGCQNELLVIPDFWVGVKSFLIANHKRSIVEQFVSRKLKAEAPDVPEVENFFDYVSFLDEQGREGVQVYHLLESLFSAVHERLNRFGLRPGRVTTPGLLWESKLRRKIANFDSAGHFLVNIVGSECFFYFFHRGRYLFSRDISFSHSLPAEDWFDALCFEIDQSRFLFSQKVKTETDRIYLVSKGRGDIEAGALSARLGRETVDVDAEPWADAGQIAEELNALLYFSEPELSVSGRFVNLAHRLVRQELEWRPVQTCGLVVGFCLLLLLTGQAMFLQWWPEKKWLVDGTRRLVEQRQILRKFNSDLELAAKEAERPRMAESISRLALSLPEGFRLEQFSVQHEPASFVELEGQARADSADRLWIGLSALAENIKTHFPGSVPPNPAEIGIDSVRENDSNRYGPYRFNLRFNLP